MNIEIFLEWFFALNIDIQKKFLENLFNNKILIFDINRVDDIMYIKYYDGDMYYQLCFLFSDSDDILNIKLKNRIFVCDIFINNYDLFICVGNNLDKFIKMLNGKEFIDFDYFLEEEI